MTELIKTKLDDVLINTFNRMAEDYNFNTKCDELVRHVHEHIIEKWNYFINSDIELLCNELQIFIKKIVYSQSIINIFNT